MALYETGILLDGNMIIQKKFYTQLHSFNDQLRDNLLSVIYSFVRDAFSTEFESFNTDNYIVLAVPERLDNHVLLMFCIIEKRTRTRVILHRMSEAFKQFLTRFSKDDILTKDSSFFAEFSNILDQIFGDLGLNHKKHKGRKFK